MVPVATTPDESEIHKSTHHSKDEGTMNSSIFTPICHNHVEEAIRDVDSWFLENWNFPDHRSRKKFVAAGFSRVTCLYFPKAPEDRIRSACKLLTILFLIDDQLEFMSLEEGKVYNESLMPFCTGKNAPDRHIPVQWMLYDIWEEMRVLDRDLADSVVEPVFVFMRAQTAKERLSIRDLQAYLEYRQKDVGQTLLAALMRFSYGLNLSPEELDSVSEIEHNCGRHISLVNDILSYEKEKLISEKEASEGAVLCNAVPILAAQVGITIEAAKNVVWIMVRDCEFVHKSLVKSKSAFSRSATFTDNVRRYVDGLEYQMGGNELWSRTTHRYRTSDEELDGAD